MSVEPTALTIEILKEIRDEIRKTNGRVDETNIRLTDLGNDLGRRIVESETRTATAIADLAGSVREVSALLRSQHDLEGRSRGRPS